MATNNRSKAGTLKRSAPFGDFSRFRIDTFRGRFGDISFFLVDIEANGGEGEAFGPYATEENATKAAAKIVTEERLNRESVKAGGASEAGMATPNDKSIPNPKCFGCGGKGTPNAAYYFGNSTQARKPCSRCYPARQLDEEEEDPPMSESERHWARMDRDDD